MDRTGPPAGKRLDAVIPVAVAGLCLVAAIAINLIGAGFYPVIQGADAAVGLVFAVLGLIAWRRDRTMAWLAFATSLTWFAGSFLAIAAFWHRGPLLHLIVRGTARRSRPLYRAVVAAGYAVSVLPMLWSTDVIAAVLAIGFLIIVLVLRSPLTAWACAAILMVVIVGHAVARALVPGGGAIIPSVLVYDIALVAIAAIAAVSLLRTPPARVADLVVDLHGSRSDLLRDELAAAIGDRSLRVGAWDAARGSYVTPEGAEIDPADPLRGRATTVIDSEGRHEFVLEHAPGALDDPALLDAVAAAARVTARNAALRAVNAQRIAELEGSRRRLVTAGDRGRMELRADVERIVLLKDFPARTGYLLKDRLGDIAVLVDSLRRLQRGETVIDPTIIAQLLGRNGTGGVDDLSVREREVLGLVAEGMSNRAIADRLKLSERTVESHVTAVFSRLGLDEDPASHRRVLAVLAYLRGVGN